MAIANVELKPTFTRSNAFKPRFCVCDAAAGVTTLTDSIGCDPFSGTRFDDKSILYGVSHTHTHNGMSFCLFFVGSSLRRASCTLQMEYQRNFTINAWLWAHISLCLSLHNNTHTATWNSIRVRNQINRCTMNHSRNSLTNTHSVHLSIDLSRSKTISTPLNYVLVYRDFVYAIFGFGFATHFKVNVLHGIRLEIWATHQINSHLYATLHHAFHVAAMEME